jgi:hypothetical protein
VPVLLSVKVWVVLDPFTTFPKLRLGVLAASIPEPVEFDADPDFEAGVPALVKPTQPASDTTAKKERMKASRPSGARRLREM